MLTKTLLPYATFWVIMNPIREFSKKGYLTPGVLRRIKKKENFCRSKWHEFFTNAQMAQVNNDASANKTIVNKRQR